MNEHDLHVNQLKQKSYIARTSRAVYLLHLYNCLHQWWVNTPFL